MDVRNLIRLTHTEWLAARPAVLRLHRAVIGQLLRHGVMTWGTKSFEFWTLLMAALRLAEPRAIVELGSGRSTSYLCEYAQKQGAALASIEQSRAYSRKVRRGLRNSFLNPACVHHVPLADDGWYSAHRLDAVASRAPDCLFIDGPVGDQEELGAGQRTGTRAVAWLARAVGTVTLLIVDDVHRPANRELLRALVVDRPDLAVRYLHYTPHEGAANIVALAASEETIDALAGIAADLGIDLVASLDPAVPDRAGTL